MGDINETSADEKRWDLFKTLFHILSPNLFMLLDDLIL